MEKKLAPKIILQAKNLCKSFLSKGSEKNMALNNLSFSVPEGSIMAFVGPDGAGKTTLLRIISGLLNYDSGELCFYNKNYSELHDEQQELMGYMPQRFGLYEDLTVRENLDLYADLRGLDYALREDRYQKLLKITALDPFCERLAGNLSGGMKQKLGLICTLVRAPKLLLLDEPTVGVDPVSRRELWEIVDLLTKESGMSTVVSTSYLDEAERCDEVLLLYNGHPLAQGKPDKIKEISDGLVYRGEPKTEDNPRKLQGRLLGLDFIVDAVPQSGAVRFVHKGLERDEQKKLDLMLEGARVEKIPARLEDSFMLLLKKEAKAGTLMADSEPEMGSSLNPQTELGESGNLTSFDADKKPLAPNKHKFLNLILHPFQAGKTKASDKKNGALTKIGMGNKGLYQDDALEEHIKRGSLSGDRGSPIIETRNVSRLFGDFIAVNNVSFSVYQGEVFGLLGPNGAGKTTTFRMLCGLLPASKGSLYVDGVDVRVARQEARKHLGYVAQKFSLYSPLSVKENLSFFAGAYGLRGEYKEQRIKTVASDFFLEDRLHMAAGDLPGGYKQRLAMAVALLHNPAILFLDEPTSGADPQARRAFWRRISHLSQRGVTIIVTTHFMEEAEYCDRILIQDQGLMLALGTPDEIREEAKKGGDSALSMEEAFIQIVEKFRLSKKDANKTN